jgi:hypothetical protein
MAPPIRLSVKIGDRFGRGVVIGETRCPRPGRAGQRAALLLCDDGNEYVCRLSDLFRSNPTHMSCGCLMREHSAVHASTLNLTHGLTCGGKSENYIRHKNMMARCYNPSRHNYDGYGGRGIEVYEPWHDPVVFCEWIDTHLGPCPQGYSLDRIDNDSGYFPWNVRWADAVTQANNQRH